MPYATGLLAILILGNALLFHFAFWVRTRPMLLLAEAAQYEEADSKYRFLKFDLLALATLFAIAPALGFAWYHLIKEVGGAFQHSPADVIVSLPPMWEVGALAAVFLGIFGSVVSTDLLFRSLLREGYQDYVNASYRNNPRGYRQAWLLPWMNWGMSIVMIALLAMAFNSYAHFRSDSIALNPFFGFGEARYAYSDVAEVAQVARRRAPNGDLKDRPHIAIRFVDGNVWTSIEAGRSVDPLTDQRILQLLLDKTGLSPTQHDTFP